MRLLAASSLMLFLLACGGRETVTHQQARVRNQPPATCTQADFNQCPAAAITTCADGQDPVIDYSADCCQHFSCQTTCDPTAACAGWPAPVCPAGTSLVILTTEDCCPAYQCQPTTQCDQTNAACPLALPYCGDGVYPTTVGYTDSCCPIYQCPCAVVVDYDGGGAPPSPATDGGVAAPQPDPSLCGCTYPTCAPGETLSCAGGNLCGFPCTCVPTTGNCMADSECGPNMRCDFSQCYESPGCDPTTGDGGACPAVCYGLCVGYVQNGCKADSECPTGQRCDLSCVGWGCAPASDGGVPPSPTDGGVPTDGGPAPTPVPPCAVCDPNDPTCVCAADGSCTGGTCSGQCVPLSVCDTPLPAGACPAPPPMPCDTPTQVGTDPTTCCPIWQCASCTPQGMACPVAGCYCGVQVGTDANCCPIIACPEVTAPDACPPACRADADCDGGMCVNGFCQGLNPGGLCQVDTDCFAGQSCVAGHCSTVVPLKR